MSAPSAQGGPGGAALAATGATTATPRASSPMSPSASRVPASRPACAGPTSRAPLREARPGQVRRRDRRGRRGYRCGSRRRAAGGTDVAARGGAAAGSGGLPGPAWAGGRAPPPAGAGASPGGRSGEGGAAGAPPRTPTRESVSERPTRDLSVPTRPAGETGVGAWLFTWPGHPLAAPSLVHPRPPKGGSVST